MSIVSGIVVFLLIWWLVFLMSLPIGVRSQAESDDDTVPGTPESAPESPKVGRKFLATTAISVVLFVLYYCAVTYNWMNINALIGS